MLLGIAISPLNGLTLSLLNYEGDLLVGIFGYFMGDVLGVFLCLILAVLIQRAVRNIQTKCSFKSYVDRNSRLLIKSLLQTLVTMTRTIGIRLWQTKHSLVSNYFCKKWKVI